MKARRPHPYWLANTRLRGWAMPCLFATVGAVALLRELFGPPAPPSSADLMASLLPPAPLAGGDWSHPLGTDAQGRDLLEAVLTGARLSLAVAVVGVAGAMLLGIAVGLLAGAAGGALDAAAMRAVDVQLTFPALLVALLADAVFRLGGERLLSPRSGQARIVLVLGLAIALGRWPPVARLMRAATRREWRRDYVAAARLAGSSRALTLAVHVLPNALTSVLALAALDFGLAILDESTLSYLGLGFPADRPSLGTLLRVGQGVLFSGAWWAVAVPGAILVLLVAAATLSADRLLARNRTERGAESGP